MELPFALETDLERRLAADPDWRAGIEWGRPRSGHPEGAVRIHVGEVLANLERIDLLPADRSRLRIAALVHDTFKFRVDTSLPKTPPNEHGFLASRWLERYVDDPTLVRLVELHDEGFRAWRAYGEGDDAQVWRRLVRIVAELAAEIGLFVAFYWADNGSGDKSPEQLGWFVERMRAMGLDVSLPEPR